MNYVKISEYITLSKLERQGHLELSESCIEVGGSSPNFKGLLCHFLRTTMPIKIDGVLLCHACNNGKCSNCKHLYWGTHKDNWDDAQLIGNQKSFHQKCIEKFGEKEWLLRLKSRGNRQFGAHGGWNKLSDARLHEIRKILEKIQIGKYGWVITASKELQLSHTQVRRIVNKYFPELQAYRRMSFTIER